MATATASAPPAQRNGVTIPETAKAALTMEAEITSGFFKGKNLDVTFAPDGSIVGVSDPKLTPEEHEAWNELMSVSKGAEQSALELRTSVDKLNGTLERVESFLAEGEA